MKFNMILTTIAVAISALVAYALYSCCRMDEAQLLVAIFGGATLCCTNTTTLGISFERSRTTVNIKVVSGVFSVLFLVSNIIFCCLTSFAYPLYIIINGFLLLIWMLIVYSIHRAMSNDQNNWLTTRQRSLTAPLLTKKILL